MFTKIALVILTLLVISKWIDGIVVENFYFALITAVLLGLASITIKPVLTILTLPVHIITFGISALFVNAGIFWFISTFVSGFSVTGLLPAILGSLAISAAGVVAEILT